MDMGLEIQNYYSNAHPKQNSEDSYNTDAILSAGTQTYGVSACRSPCAACRSSGSDRRDPSRLSAECPAASRRRPTTRPACTRRGRRRGLQIYRAKRVRTLGM